MISRDAALGAVQPELNGIFEKQFIGEKMFCTALLTC